MRPPAVSKRTPSVSGLDASPLVQPQRANSAGQAILGFGKTLYVFGAFATFNFLKTSQMSLVTFLAASFTVAATVLGALHKPWRPTKGRQITMETMILCWKTSVCLVVAHWLLIIGLVNCAPARFLVLEHLEVLVTYGLAVALGTKRLIAPKLQGGVLIFGGYLVSLWHDTTPVALIKPHHGILVDETNTYDAFVGMCAISLASVIMVGTKNAERQLCAVVGSLKRVHALQAGLALTVLYPVSVLHYCFAGDDSPWPSLLQIGLMVFVSIIFLVPRFAIMSMQAHFKVPERDSLRTSVATTASWGVALHSLHSWDTPVSISWSQMTTTPEPWVVAGANVTGNATMAEDGLDPGASSALAIYFAALFVTAGVYRFTMDDEGTQLGSMLVQRVLPLFEPGDHASVSKKRNHNTLHSMWRGALKLLKQVSQRKTSRRLLAYLCVSAGFGIVELLYGRVSGAFGLISDAFLVAFDCGAVAIALAAAYVATWPPSADFTFGYTRAEDVGGFVNGIFLIFDVVNMLLSAICRYLQPRSLMSERFLITHILGLAINGVGLALFQEGAFGSQHKRGRRPSSNLYGVWLHILADALGSFALIVASLASHYFHFKSIDVWLAVSVGALLIYLVYPLLRDSVPVLLQRQPTSMDENLAAALAATRRLEYVQQIDRPHFWSPTLGKHEGTLQITVPRQLSAEGCSTVVEKIREIFRQCDVRLTLQVNRRAAGEDCDLAAGPP